MKKMMRSVFISLTMSLLFSLQADADITKFVAHGSGKRNLIEVVENGSRAGVVSALVRGEDIEQTDDHGHTALVVALNAGHVHLARLLVEKGANINYVDHDGYTPLMWVCKMTQKSATIIFLF